MMISVVRLASDRIGSAAAELALVMPLLLALMLGGFELGNYFLSEHVVQKAVRDASRYAARLPMTSYPACSPTEDAEADIQRLARTGTPEEGGAVRLFGWTDNSTVTVALICDPSGTYTGLYSEFPDGVPVVTVTARVPYPPFFGVLGLSSSTLNLNAASQAAVFGA